MANSDNPTTVSAWALGLMRRMDIPTTGSKGYATWAVLCVWALKEGGHFKNSAKFNPLNTSQPMPGSSKINSHNVQSYTSWDQGYEATIKTLNNGRYTNMVEDLRNGNSAKFVKDLAASPWGTGSIVDPKGNIPTAAQKTDGIGNGIANGIADGVQSVVDPGTQDSTTTATGLGGLGANANKLLETLGSGEWWKRVGIASGGALIIILAVIVMVWAGKDKLLKSTVGTAVKGVVK